MRSNYRKLGLYIREVSEKNKDLQVEKLLGVSINKVFIPSIANTIGTDMSKYKIVRTHQFAYGPVTSRNSDRISVALLDQADCIISTSYTVFEIIDHEALDAEYLMMWFRRPEFDRYARYKSHGSVREIFGWDEMCDVELPIPAIEKQREVVREYNTIVTRIQLNEQLNRKLEETAQAIYKYWFVDFEFPISAQYAASVGKPQLEGKPYKSSGGEMVSSKDIEQTIPKNWEYKTIEALIDEEVLYKNQDGNHGEIHPKKSDFVDVGIPFIMANDLKHGSVDTQNCSFITKVQADSLRIGFSKKNDVLLTHKATMGRTAIVPNVEPFIVLTPQVTYYRVCNTEKMCHLYLYCLFSSSNFQHYFGSSGEQSTRNYIGIMAQRQIKIILPDSKIISTFSTLAAKIFHHKSIIFEERFKLSRLRDMTHVKMSSTTPKTENAA